MADQELIEGCEYGASANSEGVTRGIGVDGSRDSPTSDEGGAPGMDPMGERERW